ncbi:MAG: two-component sensor histidine kinase [Pseudobutyrivibrio sp.]|nr:two-component sensor histidine kinase [Pseudobutyrivibrio sp.]
MEKLFKTLCEKCEAGTLYGDENTLENIGLFDRHSVAVIVTSADGRSLITSNVDPKFLSEQLNYSLLGNDGTTKEIKAASDYRILSQNIPQVEDTFLILIGVLPDSNIVFIRSSLGSMEHTISITNKFFLMMVVIDSILCVLVGRYFIAKFTKPLFKLIDITKRISNFDFEATYHPQIIYNEMDDLGEHVNEMSTTLKRAIDQLQTANESLKHDLELKDEAENMRKEFVSNVSHELKTPIALIQGYAEGLQEGIMDDEVSRQIYLDIIIDEANKMNRLVREMLILNQLEAGQMNMDLVDFDLTEMIDSVVDSNKINFEAQNITYTFINKGECIVHADEFLVEQVVTNFISNAIHYVMNENIITVRYDYTKKGKVRISVFNSGNSIAKKDIKHIWEKFYKADKARSREYGGSGIGLSVVKATMELLHEKYGVENLSNGVEFWFELSLTKDTKIKENS